MIKVLVHSRAVRSSAAERMPRPITSHVESSAWSAQVLHEPGLDRQELQRACFPSQVLSRPAYDW
jgi:hypothetical protein